MTPRVGDRVRVTGVMNDPDPLPVGLEGTVMQVSNVGTQFEQYGVSWDGKVRGLMLLPGDPYTIL